MMLKSMDKFMKMKEIYSWYNVISWVEMHIYNLNTCKLEAGGLP